MVRNLLFYCYPVKGSAWPWHVERLLEHSGVWNGRRILVLSLDRRTEPEGVVRERFAPLGAEILVRENDPESGEQAHFVDALSILESQHDDEATFYAHAKGVTREGVMLRSVLRWSRFMYQANLSFPSLVEKKLSEFPAVGCLRWKLEKPRKGWCFAGTFFWLRHSAIFGRDWKRINKGFYGVEDYPGVQFPIEESYCLTKGGMNPIDLYSGGINKKYASKVLESLAEEEGLCTRAS